MAPSKLPSYKELRNGRTVWKPAFKEAVIADYLGGQSEPELRAKFNLPKNVVHAWVHLAKRGGKRTAPRGTTTPRTVTRPRTVVKPNASLLEQALELQGEPVEAANEVTNQQIDLAVAFVKGAVSHETVKRVMGKSEGRKWMLTTWLGHCFAGAVRSGRVK